MARLYGYLPDPAGEERGLEVGNLVGSASVRVPELASVRAPFEILDQAANCCVGCGFWGALTVAGLRENRHVDVSYMAIYAIARELEKPGLHVLADVGCFPNKAITGLESFGVVARHRWKDDEDPTKPVPVDVLEAGAIARVEGVFRIFETGAQRVNRIKQSIAQGHAVVYAQPVDKAFEDGTTGVYPGVTGTVQGGHCMHIISYRPGAFQIRNSWGPNWSDRGSIWIADDFIAEGDGVGDFTAVTLAPETIR